MKPNLDEAAVKRIWQHSVLPYIEERLFGQNDTLDVFDLDTLRREISKSDESQRDETVANARPKPKTTTAANSDAADRS